ncbi:hypothetical protein AWENTII_010256 [Aspergillus wentii]
MSKKFKSQASSSRAAASTFGSFGGFSGSFSSQGREPSSLTYVAEPPDLSQISEAQLAIAFKNFLKKDEVTRTKALDDLKDYVATVEGRSGTLDDGFLEAWVKIYPRASIDLARRVRQLAHTIQGSVAGLVGKRIARYLPKVVGAWLAGLYDNDRPVQRSAVESFTRVFSTDEKRNSVWKIYQSSVLDFADDVILQQTPLTLSDERTVKPDDAEAKYARVAGTALLLFNRILGTSSHEDLQKNLPAIESLLGSKSLFAFCYHEDPFVRRSVYTLLRSAVSKEPEELDWKIISAAVIGKSLHISQIGSASDLSECLLQATSARPQLWTDDYTGKSSSSKRLLQYIQKGSQGGSGSFWPNLAQLLQVIPLQALAKTESQSTVAEGGISLPSAIALTEAFQEGLNSREEPRQNQLVGWKSYIDTGIWLATLLSQDDKQQFIEGRLSPLLEQYVKAEPDLARWSLPAPSAEAICADYIITLVKNDYERELELLWTRLSDGVLESVKLSSPEQSKDFRMSQDAICAQAKRLLTLEAAALARSTDVDHEPRISSVFEKTGLPLLENCLQVLQTRNGKPYGAAAVVEETINNNSPIARRSEELLKFVQNDAPELLFSPSADRLTAIILSCRSWDGFGTSFEKIVERVIQLGPEQSNADVLKKLLSTLDFKEIDDKNGLNALIMRALDRACKGNPSYWPIVIAALQNQTSRGELTDSIFLSIIESLSTENIVFDALHGLSQLATSAPTAVREFQNGAHGSKLAGKLLYLTESPSEEVANLAESLIKTLKETSVSETSTKSSLEILRHGFDHVTEESLSVESLLNIAEELLQSSKPEEKGQLAKEILPSRQSWENALGPFLELPPRVSTAITSPIGGIVHLIDRELPDTFYGSYERIPRDSNHCSSAFRLAYFTTRILSLFEVAEYLGTQDLETLFYNLPLAIQVIDDDLSIENCNGIAGLELPEQREAYMEIVNDGRKLINTWIRSNSQVIDSEKETISSVLYHCWESKLENLGGVSPKDYRVGEAFARVMAGLDSLDNIVTGEDITKICRESRTANAIRSASWFSVLRPLVISNPSGTRLCNELVADSTGLKPQDERKDGLRKLALLNILFSGEENLAASIPTQRLVFLVKHLMQCLQSELKSQGVKAEIIQTLSFVLPCLHEIYGSHWEESMEILSTTWREASGGDEALPVLISSFRLFARLRSIADNEDSNDDVKDAWSDRKATLCNNLISTLRKFDSETAFHLPRDVTVGLLCRLVNTIPVEKLEDVNRIFPLLTAQSRVIQCGAYIVLHRYIPSIQEQVSFNVALSKSTVSLPDELMSLLLEAPTMESIASSHGDDKIWTTIRSYLLSWKVVFDHFSNASLPVQENYVSNIKENDSLIPLLEFMFDFLQKSNEKVIDASKFDIRSFELDQSETSEKETQWILVHLYFLCLKHLSNMTKNWWLDAKKRIKGPVETWTEKFVRTPSLALNEYRVNLSYRFHR